MVISTGQRDRCRRILALVPKFNASSDVSDATSDEEEVNSRSSSPASSINSSLENLDFNSPDPSSNNSYIEN
ncbi:hypothetical protein HF086_015631 [Spodoptera exigua]|uniref:Uncharacterized protein n=1 Tax=Spodoptera exigua TaxID=7107 RepID=A0A922SKM3_SPOEX|nr:hypothetical protein HF086_015631 [Spodoptera exigua]